MSAIKAMFCTEHCEFHRSHNGDLDGMGISFCLMSFTTVTLKYVYAAQRVGPI